MILIRAERSQLLCIHLRIQPQFKSMLMLCGPACSFRAAVLARFSIDWTTPLRELAHARSLCRHVEWVIPSRRSRALSPPLD